MIPTLNPVTAGGGLALPAYISLAKRHGFSAIDFSILQAAKLVEEQDFEAVAALFDEAKILPVNFGLPVEWRQDEASFQNSLELLSAQAKLAQDLGCSRCTTWVLPSNNEPVEDYASRSIARFAQIGKILEDQGVRFGLEFIGPYHFRTNPDQIWFYDIHGALQAVDAIERAGELENIGILLDSFHWYTSGGNMMDLASIPLEQIIHVHINDAPDVPVHEQIDNVRLLPGASGVIDLTGFLGTLNALGYDGPIAVETFSEALKTMDVEEAAGQAAASVAGVLNAANIKPVILQ